MNLFLYIPSHSAHPPGVIKSLIFGLLSTYHKQNTLPNDFIHFSSLLFNRLLARGHQRDTIKPIFMEAAKKLDALKEKESKEEISTHKSRITNGRRQLFFHLPYHPRSISRKKLQSLYNTHCNLPNNFDEGFKSMKIDNGGQLEIEKLTIAYSRARNLRDVLCPSTFEQSQDCQVSNYLNPPGNGG